MELVINTDSKLVIHGATRDLARREDSGYLDVENEGIWRAMIARLRERRTRTCFQWIKGHSGNYGNDKADELARLGAEKPQSDAEELDLEVPEIYRITGAKLSSLKQADAYKMIKKIKHTENMKKKKQYRKEIERRKTTTNLERTRYEAIAFGGEVQDDDKIWKSLRSKDLSQKTRQFLWRTMHEAHRVGPYWTNFKNPEYEDRGYCIECDKIEDMEHILTKCKAAGQKTVWRYAKALWNQKKAKWRKPNLASILASPMADFKNQKGEKKTGKSRFFKILMSECAFTIWKLRNSRVIPDSEGNFNEIATEREILAKVNQALNIRLDQDQKLTNRTKYGRKALTKKAVIATWSNVLEREEALPDDWIGEAGVLVGRARFVDRQWDEFWGEGGENTDDEERNL